MKKKIDIIKMLQQMAQHDPHMCPNCFMEAKYIYKCTICKRRFCDDCMTTCKHCEMPVCEDCVVLVARNDDDTDAYCAKCADELGIEEKL